MSTTKTIYTMAEDIDCTFIHGITGQEVSTGTLEAGALVKNIREHGVSDWSGETIYRFEASTNGGRSWYTQESYSRPAVN